MMDQAISPQTMRQPAKKDSFTSYLGMIIAVASFAMLFIALLASYGILRARAGLWMSYAIGTVPLLRAWLNTGVIVLSSFTYHMGTGSARNEEKNRLTFWLNITFMIGVIFLVLQWNLWRMLIEDGFTISAHQAGSVFYMLSGLHGMHIIGGLCLMIWLMRKIRHGGNMMNTIKLVGMFWHFLTVIWVVIFITVILI